MIQYPKPQFPHLPAVSTVVLCSMEVPWGDPGPAYAPKAAPQGGLGPLNGGEQLCGAWTRETRWTVLLARGLQRERGQ